MRMIMFLVLALLQLPLFAQAAGEADAVLDKALAALKADAPVCMDYTYRVMDDDGELLQDDKGLIYMDGNRYALLMQDMKVWCDGKVQWSYMREVNEVYVTDAASDEAQSLSPIYIMEHYRAGRAVSVAAKDGVAVVELRSLAADAECVQLHIQQGNNRLVAMFIDMPGQGCVEVLLDGYTANCGADGSVFTCPVDQFPTAEIIDMR